VTIRDMATLVRLQNVRWRSSLLPAPYRRHQQTSAIFRKRFLIAADVHDPTCLLCALQRLSDCSSWRATNADGNSANKVARSFSVSYTQFLDLPDSFSFVGTC